MWKALQRFNFPFQFLAPGYILNSYKLVFINFIPKQISKHIQLFLKVDYLKFPIYLQMKNSNKAMGVNFNPFPQKGIFK